MPKKPVRQSRPSSRSRHGVEPPQQPHIVSFRLSPAEFEQLNSHLAEIGTNRSDFVRRAVMSMARGEMKFTEVMPMAVTGIERDVFELRKALAANGPVQRCMQLPAVRSQRDLASHAGAHHER
jgi:hypothetical protein